MGLVRAHKAFTDLSQEEPTTFRYIGKSYASALAAESIPEKFLKRIKFKKLEHLHGDGTAPAQADTIPA
jgi:hypothetical protein